MNRDDTSDLRPHYARIGDILRDRIAAGLYPVGSQLPTESELCAEFGLSRHTVRESLRLLSEAGLIARRQGSGSQVIAVKPHQSYVHAMRSLNELFQYAADTRFRIKSIGKVAGSDHEDDLGTGATGEWLNAIGIRLEQDDDIAICFSHIFINPAFAAMEGDLLAIPGAIYRYIEDRFGVEVALVEQDIRVTPIPPAAAAALSQKLKSWSVRVVRRYLDAEGRLILASVNYHPAERFSYSMRLRREGSKGNWS